MSNNYNEDWIGNVWITRIIRIVILVLSGSSFLFVFLFSTNLAWTFCAFTIQSNLFVLIWTIFALIFQEKYKDHWFFSEIVRVAITVYITITFIIFAIMLSGLYRPTDLIAIYNNLTFHYIIPCLFIADWVLTESKRDYEWKYALYLVIYPLIYLVQTLILGAITFQYIYPFLDMNALGIPLFIVVCFILAGVFIGLGGVYIFLNKKLKPRLS